MRSADSPAADQVRPRRTWLWVGLGGLCLLALLLGAAIRAGTHGGGVEALMIGLAGLAAVLLLAGELLVVLQATQAHEAAAAALAQLPSGHRVSGRIRVRGAGRPVVVDHVVVRPDGRAWAVLVDGSTNPPRPGDGSDGLARLLPTARRGAEVLARAAAAGVLPKELGLRRRTAIRPCILTVRRPLRTGERDGVLGVAAGDAATVLCAE